MKNLIYLVAILSILSCGSSDDKGNQSITSGEQTLQAKLNTYNVNASERKALLEDFDKLKKELVEIEQKLLVEALEDREMFSEYVEAEDKGLIRLLSHNSLTQINGGGRYYSFSNRTHDYGYGSDISFSNGDFSVGFAGANYGFFTLIGDTDLDDLDLGHPQLKYMLEHSPSNKRRAHHDYSREGKTVDGYAYKNRISALNGMTYAVRSVNYGYYDILVGFQVVRKDESDGSVILKWKTIKKFPVVSFTGQ